MKIIRRVILFSLIFVIAAVIFIAYFDFYHLVSAATITSAATGRWTNPSTWTGGVVPSAADLAQIQNGHTVTYDPGNLFADDFEKNAFTSWTSSEAESALHKAFNLLKDDIRKQIKMLEKISAKRQLTEEEGKVIKQLKKGLDNAEKFVRKEIKDIEKSEKQIRLPFNSQYFPLINL